MSKSSIDLALGRALFQAREQAGFTLETAAGLAGISVSRLRKIEAGNQRVRADELVTIARLFRASLSSLFEHYPASRRGSS
ncbi:MAG: helix-turn-helix transcriptional regulator [Proteobacteria bacterium]|nr:helix-turn-helix transcriptional regulator [Pseudomonadota bacterium]